MWRGIYIVGEPVDDWQEKIAEVLSCCDPTAVVGRTAAAALWGLDGFADGAAPVVLVGRSARSRLPGVCRTTCLPEAKIIRGMRVSSVMDTLIDLGAGLRSAPSAFHVLTPADRVELALESALRKNLVVLDDVMRAVAAAPAQRPGRSVLAQVMRRRPEDAPPTESFLETRGIQVLRNAGAPDGRRQVDLFDERGRFMGRVDLVVGSTIIEFDGREHHARVGAFERDRHRWRAWQRLGYRIVPSTWVDVEHEPGPWLADVWALL